MIGPITVVSEASIGSNTRRIEAVTGTGALDRLASRENLLAEAAALLRTDPEHVGEAIERLLERQRAAEKALEAAQARELQGEAAALVAAAIHGSVVARRDGLTPDQLRDLAQSVRAQGHLRSAIIGGSPDGIKASVAVSADRSAEHAALGGQLHAGDLVKQIAPLLGGGGGGSPEVAVAGGKNPSGIDAALDEARRLTAGAWAPVTDETQPISEVSTRPGRALGIDLGARRIGIAVSDSSGTLATPRGTIVRSGDVARDRRALVDLAIEEEAVVVVVGHPRSLDGSRGPAALAAEEEARLLEGLLEEHGIRVELFDERLTTVSAHQQLRAGGVKGRNQRAVVDQTAAAVMLMAWLDGRRAAR